MTRTVKKEIVIPTLARSANTNFRSKAIETIISGPPDFLSRYAMLFFVSILLSLFTGSFFIKHAKYINVSALIVPVTTKIAPYTVNDKQKPAASADLVINNRFYAYAVIKNADMHELKTGMQAILDFPIYPSADFGSVKGYIESLKSTPENDEYLTIKIKLPDGLVTSDKKQLPYIMGLTAEIRVNVADVSLFNYFFSKN